MLLSDNAGDGGAPRPSVSNIDLFRLRRQLSRYFSFLAVYRRCARGRSELAVHFPPTHPIFRLVDLVYIPLRLLLLFGAFHFCRCCFVQSGYPSVSCYCCAAYFSTDFFFSSLAVCYVACRYIRSFHLLVTPVLALLAGVPYPHLTHLARPCFLHLPL